MADRHGQSLIGQAQLVVSNSQRADVLDLGHATPFDDEGGAGESQETLEAIRGADGMKPLELVGAGDLQPECENCGHVFVAEFGRAPTLRSKIRLTLSRAIAGLRCATVRSAASYLVLPSRSTAPGRSERGLGLGQLLQVMADVQLLKSREVCHRH